ncbi:DUF2269 family protein [Streptomyces sp. SID14515]|uniref:DUF2269 family protein n=1 Tax=Streptomyces sp. SID14515 TaxID=2706074 RepID=UPI0013CAE37B|nr:DUF2269 family protein [Streptomyces sp. SID14515]NEB38024.1 DUF2269 family protein [Streptomyces sp. SID14515]
MTKLFLSLHVLAAVLAVGPVTVAASMFPKALRRAREAPADREAYASLRLLHRICRVYAVVGVAVPVSGFVTASSLGVLGSAWLITSMILTAAAAAVLALLILPAQDRELAEVRPPGGGAEAGTGAEPEEEAQAGAGVLVTARRSAGRLAMHTGIFNLLWATVTVLMIVRPGSTTGA